MNQSRIVVPFIFVACFVATAAALAADASPPRPPRAADAEAEQILKRAREALAKVHRFEIDCLFSQVDHYFEMEDLYQVKCYLEPSAGYLQEIRPVDVSGKESRAHASSGRAYRLRSRRPERSLYANGQLTEINDAERTYGTPKCAPGDPRATQIADLDRPAAFAASIIPLGLDWCCEFDVIRKWYRIAQTGATPSTVSISLTMRPECEFYDKDHPSREEVVLDRKTLLPIMWTKTGGGSDLLVTYRRFDLNAAPRELKVSLKRYEQIEITTGLIMMPPRDKNAPSQPVSRDQPSLRFDISVSGEEDRTQDAYLAILRATVCVVRLLHLF
jgi:hypothetical protein